MTGAAGRVVSLLITGLAARSPSVFGKLAMVSTVLKNDVIVSDVYDPYGAERLMAQVGVETVLLFQSVERTCSGKHVDALTAKTYMPASASRVIHLACLFILSMWSFAVSWKYL